MKITSNKKFIFGILFKAFMVYGLALMPALLVAFHHADDGVADSMFSICLICIIIGKVGAGHFKLSTDHVKVAKMRVCYMTTFTTWILLIILSALPYYFAPPNITFMDCLFESCASWTTTGSTTLEVASLPAALQLWRSTCNWLGGLGIIFLTLQFMPNWQFVGQNLAATELPGPGFLKLKSTFRKAYRRIVGGYIILTSLQFILLICTGMPVFTSLLTCLSNSSTSGLLHINNGVITALPLGTKVIITLFAFFGSINFSIPIMLLLGKVRMALKGTEFRFHSIKIIFMTLFVSFTIFLSTGITEAIEELPEVLMQVVSFASTSGFIISDCKYWPVVAKSFIVIMMFIGSCAVSTGGGIKNARLIIALKTSTYGIYKHIHPKSVRTLSYNNEPLKSFTVVRANLYVIMFMTLYLLGAILLTLDNTTVETALAFSEAMITNTGISITELGNNGQIIGWTGFSKLVMMFLMLAGRLEIYPMLLIFSKSFWFSNSNK